MLEALGVGVAALALLVGVLIAIRKRELSRATVEVRFGLFRAYKGVEEAPRAERRLLKKLPTTTLLLAVGSAPLRDHLLAVPFMLHNRSKLPIRSAVLRLQYSSEFFVDDEQLVSLRAADGGGELIEGCPRKAQVLGYQASVDIPIGLIRPGEGIVPCDWLRFERSLCERRQAMRRMWLNEDVPPAVWDLSSLVALCTLHVQLLSESTSAYHRHCRVILLRASTLDEIKSETDCLVRAFWGGKYPRPGIYFIPQLPRFLSRRLWPNELMRHELAEAVDPHLRRFESRLGEKLLFELPWESGRTLLKLSMPPWLSEETRTTIRSTEQLEELFYRKRVSDLKRRLIGWWKARRRQ